MSTSTLKITIALLAGGKSTRMGTNKCFVPLQGKPMIERVLERLNGIERNETILITDQPASYLRYKMPKYPDVIPNKAALGGIYSALSHSQHPYTLVIACDMPFLNQNLIRYLIKVCGEEGENCDAIVPRFRGAIPEVFAIYSKNCLETIRQQIEANEYKVSSFYPNIRVRYVDEPEYASFDSQGLSFVDVNTVEDLKKAQRLFPTRN